MYNSRIIENDVILLRKKKTKKNRFFQKKIYVKN